MKKLWKKVVESQWLEPEVPESLAHKRPRAYETEELAEQDLDAVAGGGEDGLDAGSSLWLFRDS